jgi:DNA repair exonuclease SbcCD ATPase subunit
MSTGEREKRARLPNEKLDFGTPETANKSPQAVDPLAGNDSLEKIREILFGEQVRETEKRFARQEERLLRESTDLREDVKKRFESLETYIKKEVESLMEQLKGERDERLESIKQLSGDLKDAVKSLEKKISQLEDQGTKNQRELRQQILDQSKSLSDEIRQKYEEISKAIGAEIQELRTDKLDRATLASFFKELAIRLTGEFKLPKPEDLHNG